MTNERSVGIKEIKPKILNTLDHVISNLQAEESVNEVEWQGEISEDPRTIEIKPRDRKHVARARDTLRTES